MMRFRALLRHEPAVVVVYAVLAGIVVLWAINTPNLGILPITNSIGQKLPIVATTIGVAIVLISRGIDLSVGGTLTVVNVIIARGADSGGDVWLWAAVALVVALVAGFVNGFFVGVVGLSPLIVTLANLSILLGIALYILPVPGGSVPPWFTRIPMLLIGPIPLVAILLVAIPLLVWWPIKRSPYGTALYAVGNDEAAAFTSGVRVRSTIITAYVLSAGFAWLGGVLLTMNAGSGDPAIGVPYTLNAIAGAVVGGVALAGGRGTIAGAVAGALVMSFIHNLLFALGVNTYWQFVVTGSVLLAAVSFPLALERLSSRKGVAV